MPAAALLVLLAACGGAYGQEVNGEVSTLRIKPRAVVRGTQATLGDVLSFAEAAGELVKELADKPVGEPVRPPGSQDISHEQIARRLGELNVNLARVMVSGAALCRVSFETPEIVQPRVELQRDGREQGLALASDESAPLIRPRPEANTRNLAGQIRDLLGAEFKERGTLEIEFEAACQEFLDLTSPPFEFSIRAGKQQTLGLRELTVTIRRDGRTQRTVRIGANLKLIRQVLVAARPLNVGGVVKRDGLEFATREFTADGDLGLDSAEAVVGQQVAQFVPPGQMLRSKDLKQVDLVKRGQPVTVEGGAGVSLRVTGVALDSGRLGDSVRVRLGDVRGKRREIRGVVTSVGVVRMSEEVP